MDEQEIRIAALNAAIAMGFTLDVQIVNNDGSEIDSVTETRVLRAVDVAESLAYWITTGESDLGQRNLFN